jgi:hypothetical protein
MADELKKKELQRRKEAQKMTALSLFETKRWGSYNTLLTG